MNSVLGVFGGARAEIADRGSCAQPTPLGLKNSWSAHWMRNFSGALSMFRIVIPGERGSTESGI
jgi:hypothetical protein